MLPNLFKKLFCRIITLNNFKLRVLLLLLIIIIIIIIIAVITENRNYIIGRKERETENCHEKIAICNSHCSRQ